ncbi:methyltransferase-like 26 B isoform X1 [Scomber japonicus]|uniref:methyltransferase-like 26 B isoform X1 n=1 Tax=Scomber japonicus TaxID=13676 RepID=UPI0023063F0F|nr:methyltransferase-like 26 B isoform X1 [Scomber japonicus]
MLLSPQAERNWEDLCTVLEDVLDDQSHRQLFALELGSGTGQHVIRFAQKLPFVTWQPSDIKEESRESIKAYIAAINAKTVLQPVHLDAREPWEKWAGIPHNSCDLIIAINLLQYSSFKTAEGVFSGAGQILRSNALLITYGVYAINGTIIPSCNELLDAELRNLNPDWGLPDIDVLRQLAYGNGMRLERMVSHTLFTVWGIGNNYETHTCNVALQIEMEEYYKCLIFRKI